MPDFTITLRTKAVQRLRAVLQRYNDNQGASLTLKQFLHLHLQEMAVADELDQATRTLTEQVQRDASHTLQAAIATIQKQQEQDANDTLQTSIRAARDELLAEL